MKRKRNILKWTPTRPVKPRNYFSSSEAQETGNMGFTPSYNQGNPSITLLLSNEYLRMWMKERDEYAAFIYPDTESKNPFYNRRHVQLMRWPRYKYKILPPMNIREFKKAMGKVDHTRPSPPPIKTVTKISQQVRADELKKDIEQSYRFKTHCVFPPPPKQQDACCRILCNH